MTFQTPRLKDLDRKDHIWNRVHARRYKCLLCGAITDSVPPHYPTDKGWEPNSYEELTDKERNLIPFKR